MKQTIDKQKLVDLLQGQMKEVEQLKNEHEGWYRDMFGVQHHVYYNILQIVQRGELNKEEDDSPLMHLSLTIEGAQKLLTSLNCVASSTVVPNHEFLKQLSIELDQFVHAETDTDKEEDAS